MLFPVIGTLPRFEGMLDDRFYNQVLLDAVLHLLDTNGYSELDFRVRRIFSSFVSAI
jgi:hypothetical protein